MEKHQEQSVSRDTCSVRLTGRDAGTGDHRKITEGVLRRSNFAFIYLFLFGFLKGHIREREKYQKSISWGGNVS